MSYCPDNYDQWAKLDREQAEREKNAPKCCMCERPIYGEYAYVIDGGLYCEACVNESKEYVDDSDSL